MARGLAVFVELVCVSGGDSLAGVQEVHELQDRKEKKNEQKDSQGRGAKRTQPQMMIMEEVKNV